MLTQALFDQALQAPADQVPSPCMHICSINPANGYCLGCWRTLDEIAHWGDSSDADKRRLWQELLQRSQAGV